MVRTGVIRIPPSVQSACRTDEQRAWLARLPAAVESLARRWRLTLGLPFEHSGGSSAWVAPATCADGTRAVLKLGMPHLEAHHELDGLLFWQEAPVVRVLDFERDVPALLLEHCDASTPLRSVGEPEQDEQLAALLRRLWRPVPPGSPFRPLSTMLEHWSARVLASRERWRDAGVVEEGLSLYAELSRIAATDVLIATDLHAGNVLRAEREPWLVIDPKPFIGDPAYDATQHLLNCLPRLQADPIGLVCRFADLLAVDANRVRLWTFARLATDFSDAWQCSDAPALLRALSR